MLHKEIDLENGRFLRMELLEMGARPLQEKTLYGYLGLQRKDKFYVFEPEDQEDLDSCKYTCSQIKKSDDLWIE